MEDCCGFIVLPLCMFIPTKSGGNIDMGGEKHGSEAVHEPAPARQPLRPLRYPHPHQRHQRRTRHLRRRLLIPNFPVSAIRGMMKQAHDSAAIGGRREEARMKYIKTELGQQAFKARSPCSRCASAPPSSCSMARSLWSGF